MFNFNQQIDISNLIQSNKTNNKNNFIEYILGKYKILI